MSTTTIVAPATPAGSGGLAVVRLSGPGAVAVARRVFRSRAFAAGPVSHQAVYGLLHEPDEPGLGIDRCLALALLAPRSYTGEDTVEFFVHGGPAVVRMAVAACRRAGAVAAAPGEFTRRAFLNGRLALEQAESVADLIAAETEQTARGALNQLRGGFARELAAVEAPLLDLLAGLEGSFEFLEEDGVEVAPSTVVDVLMRSMAQVDRLLALAPAGRLLRDGVQIVLAGPVNAGKSALFNALLGSERAIVDDEAGTTRDVVSAEVVRRGVRCVLHDTAGLREDAGRVERKGIDLARERIAAADIVLAIDDGSSAAVAVEGSVVIAVRTKVDLGGLSPAPGAVPTSSVTGEGIDALWGRIDEVIGATGLNEAASLGVVLNDRHVDRLGECRAALAELAAMATAEPPAGAEVMGTLLAAILGRLGEVSGRVFSEHVLNTVFKRFCVGK